MNYGSKSWLVFLWLLIVALAGCAAPPESQAVDRIAAGEGGSAAAGANASHGMDCPLSVPIIAKPPDSPYRDPLPTGLYFISDDEAIWAVVEPWRQGTQKALWIKPAGAQLALRGRRLDGDAAPLWAAIPAGYDGDFQPSRLLFPTAGCWEIEARANDSVLRFVYYIKPAPAPAPEPACAQIGDVVKPDRVIIVGRVEQRALDASGRWLWLSVRVKQDLYPYSLRWETVGIDDVLPVLQDGRQEPLLAAENDYVLALHGDPWQILCPRQTLAKVDYAQEPARAAPLAPDETLWSGATVAAIEAQIKAVQRSQ